MKRVIVHPVFQNIAFKDAEKKLAGMEQGECIVRPSSKVSIHWLSLLVNKSTKRKSPGGKHDEISKSAKLGGEIQNSMKNIVDV